MSQSREQLDFESGKKSSSSNKCYMTIFVFLTLALTVSTITLGVLYGQEAGKTSDPSSPSPSDICQTPGCIKAANRILGSMNMSVDPCEDFYQYSCGQWIDDHIISESQSSINVFNDVRDSVSKSLKTVLERSDDGAHSSITKAKNFYKSCLDTDKINELGTKPINDLIAEMGGWPVLDGSAVDTTPLEERVATFNTKYGTGAIIYPYVGADSKNSKLYVFTITEPSLALPSREYYLEGESASIVAYKDYITSFLKVLNTEDSVGADVTAFDTFANEVVEFETKIAANTLSSAESRDETVLYNKKTLSGLTADVNPEFNWQTYVSKVMEIADDPTLTIDADTEVVMYALRYSSNFTDIVDDYDATFIQNYLVWRVMKARHSYMPEILRDARINYNKVVSGTSAEEARWQSCSDQAEGSFPMPVGALFVEEYFPAENKKATEDMVREIRIAFKSNLNDIDWMDAETKKKAVEKADMITEMIAYPDYIINDQKQMDDNYAGVSIDAQAFFTNAQSLNVFANQWSFAKYNTEVDFNEWISGPAIVNAFYSPSRNQIFFPAGILQPPFYDQYQPTAMNYGGIGMVIGHEITHGFDDSGANYNGEGNMVNWWSDASKAGFDEDAQCMIDQYSQQYWEAAEANLNGQLTLGENIADNGGIRESFLAFREWQATGGKDVKLPGLQELTDEQLFFLGFSQVWCGKYTEARAKQLLLTDPHSPGEFRVKVPGMNYEEFGKAYNCRKGVDNMYPSSGTCRVW